MILIRLLVKRLVQWYNDTVYKKKDIANMLNLICMHGILAVIPFHKIQYIEHIDERFLYEKVKRLEFSC